MVQCDECRGFLPPGIVTCPNCGRSREDRIQRTLIIAGVGLAVACSGIPTAVMYGPAMVDRCTDTFCSSTGDDTMESCEAPDGAWETCCGDAGIAPGIGCPSEEGDAGTDGG